jgi:hypothetical protein
MSVQLVHNAELIAMNVAIHAMDLTNRSSVLSRIFRHIYRLNRESNLLLWSGVIFASSISGFLTGYLAFFILPK